MLWVPQGGSQAAARLLTSPAGHLLGGSGSQLRVISPEPGGGIISAHLSRRVPWFLSGPMRPP